jgi:hypothetical protein
MSWRRASGVFEAHPATPVPLAPYSGSLRLPVDIPRMVRLTIDAIIMDRKDQYL